jgi:hypothetical protein
MPKAKAKPKPLYWSKARFNAARKRGHFTLWEINKAGRVGTCACGQQDPRGQWTNIGIMCETFYDHVMCGDVDKAESTLAKIEKRAAQIIAGIEKGKK